CSTEGIQNLKTLSDFRGGKFSKAYGVLIGDGLLSGLSARAIFVIDPNGKIVHKEIVSEITNEPNYEAAIAAVKQGS
ncbi:MAG: redoxin family protein, partial [Helicobacter sp.]|nr:redoxin family protein [Helicobacter sp.]